MGGGGGGGCHSKACLPKLALPWMKQFIVELCSCLSPHLHGVEKIIRVSERGCRGLLSNPTLSWRGDPRGRGLPATLMHNIVTSSVSAFIEASCFLRFAPFYRRSVIKVNPGLWGHFFPLVQSPVINTFSVRGAIICKSRARCRRGVPFRSATRGGRGTEERWLRSCCRSSCCFVSTSRGAAASYKIKDSGGSPRVAMAAGAVQVSTAPVENPLRLLLGVGEGKNTGH